MPLGTRSFCSEGYFTREQLGCGPSADPDIDLQGMLDILNAKRELKKQEQVEEPKLKALQLTTLNRKTLSP